MIAPSPVVTSKRVDLTESSYQVLIVTINRPKQLNCFNTDVVFSLAKIFSNIADGNDHDLAAVILMGNGGTFCAGADLSDPPNPLTQSSDLPECLAINPVYQMSRIQIPIIGALQGHVITGGFELALACDILVGDETTKFRDTHVKFGLAPCWGLSQKLQRRIGRGRASILSYSARPIGAKLAYEWGLLDELKDSGEGKSALEGAIEIAEGIGRQNVNMVRRYKRALDEGGAMDLAKGLQRERELGLAHYSGAVGDGTTFESAKKYITDQDRPRLRAKL